MKSNAVAVLIAGTLLLTACAVPAMEPYQPTVANLQAARSRDIGPTRVGEFGLATGLPAAMDRGITIRASTLRPPTGDSFSKYLRDCLEAELKAGGKLEAASDVVISGRLTESKVSSATAGGAASLGATFTVTRAGEVVYEKPLRVDATWPSSFVGAIAIPEAMNQYNALYGKLVGALLTDEAFKAAVRPS